MSNDQAAPEIEGMAGRQLRMRMVTIEPEGVFGPIHDHQDRPGIVYILQGTITDHSQARVSSGPTFTGNSGGRGSRDNPGASAAVAWDIQTVESWARAIVDDIAQEVASSGAGRAFTAEWSGIRFSDGSEHRVTIS